MGSKGRNHALAREAPEPAKGRQRGEDEGECFAPCEEFVSETLHFTLKSLIFHTKIASGSFLK